MNISANLEIHFHEQQLGSIFLETSGGPDEQLGEVMLLCSLALRQMVNLGNHPVSHMLAEMLMRSESHLAELAHHDVADGVRLAKYPGVPGRKRFLAKLTCTDERLNFQMKAKGFGWLAAGVGYYAPQSVMLLLRYLSQKRITDRPFLACLGAAAASCGRAFLVGRVNLANQSELAAAAVMSSALVGGRDVTPADRSAGLRVERQRAAATVDRMQIAFDDSTAITAAAHEEDDAREAGSEVTVQDFIDTFSDVPKMLEFWNLDQATRMVFHRLVQEQTAIFCDGQPSSPIAAQQELSTDIGKAVFDGYTLGRRLWGTHDKPISFSAGETDAKANGHRILKVLETIKPLDILQAAGEHTTNLVGNWVTHFAEEGIYAKLADRERSQQLLFGAILNGFSLSVAERRISGFA